MTPMRALALRLGSAPWLMVLGRQIVVLDRAVQRRTNARFGLLTLAGMSGLLLTTTGRRTGRPRTVPLMYLAVPDGYLVIGSNWGGPTHPAWSANLLADPKATIAVRGKRLDVTARLAQGDERQRLWELAVARWPAYEAYLARSGRDIRLFVLTPTQR